MSFPNLPDVDPEVDIKIEDAINLLLASIAFEELGLAHIINAEAEKIQFVLGTLHEKKAHDKHDKHHTHDKHDKCEICPTIEDLKEIDRSVERVLKNIIKKEMILEFKLENVIELSESTKKEKTDRILINEAAAAFSAAVVTPVTQPSLVVRVPGVPPVAADEDRRIIS